MLFIETRKKRVIKKAYKYLHKQFPRNTFLVYWEPHADGFFVETNDEGLIDSHVFAQFAGRMRAEVFRKAGFSVWFGWDSINGKYENVYNAEATEVQEQAKEALPAGS